MMKTVANYNFSGKKALIRVDFNVPLDDQLKVTDDTRIQAAIPTIKKVIDDRGMVILMSHLGRPKSGAREDKYSLKHILSRLSELLGKPVLFASDCIGDSALKVSKAMKPGEVLLLENLRFHKGEEAGDEAFAKELASLGDVYVNDAFGTAHRAHASTAVIAKFFREKLFGYVMAGELESINKVLHNNDHPVTAIIGGAKVSGKIQVITQLLDKIDNLLIGGGMAYTFVKAIGGKTGSSLVEEDKLELATSILNAAKEKKVKLYIPIDTVIADAFKEDAKTQITNTNEIPEGWMGLDIGPETIKLYDEVIQKSKIILWNGPMGVFEMASFENGTKSIAESLASATEKGVYTLIGGGDSVAAINKYKLGKHVSYVSTGGGALLEYIESGSLPGVKAVLEESNILS